MEHNGNEGDVAEGGGEEVYLEQEEEEGSEQYQRLLDIGMDPTVAAALDAIFQSGKPTGRPPMWTELLILSIEKK